MVKHPKYQAMDSAREQELPRIVEEVCIGSEYNVKEVPPIRPDSVAPGPVPRSSYEVVRKSDGTVVAEFHANGYFDLREEEFKPYFDRISLLAEQAASRAYNEFLSFEERGKE